MLWLRSLVLSLSIVLLSARGIPLPSPGAHLKFTVGVQGMVFCKTCKLPGYSSKLDVSPIPGYFYFYFSIDSEAVKISMPNLEF
jgi:hypothetical protein